MGRFTLELLGKVAVGPNYETIKIVGETSRTNLTTNANILVNDRGLYAQPGNVGNYNRIQLAVVPEVSLKSYVELTDHLKFHVGYSLLFLNKAVRPADQIDQALNIQPVGVGVTNPPLLPGPPSFRNSTFSVQMLNLGLEFCF
jgi:hypothetical protein